MVVVVVDDMAHASWHRPRGLGRVHPRNDGGRSVDRVQYVMQLMMMADVPLVCFAVRWLPTKD